MHDCMSVSGLDYVIEPIDGAIDKQSHRLLDAPFHEVHQLSIDGPIAGTM